MDVITAYIAQYSKEQQDKMKELRKMIHEVVPDVSEKISWGMPTFVWHKNLVHFAAFKHHIGFYPGASGVASFQDELRDYKTSKGAIQLPLNKELPIALLKGIVRFRVAENEASDEVNYEL